ncbi:sodium:solute symporter family protein [candidate division KSB1 bacterium]|nr:sodium:solute symporter family protein [candidate division KSB1 bacterium]
MIVWAILTSYLVLLMIIAWLGIRARKSGAEDFFLAGRNQGWFVTALTIMATFFSAFALMGAPGMVFRFGLPFIMFSLNVPVAAAMIWIVGHRVRVLSKQHGFVTPSDFVCYFHPSRLLNLCVCLIGFLFVLPYIVLQIKAGGYLFDVVTDGQVDQKWGAVILAALTMIYVHLGGMRSVAWTDILQGVLLVGGMIWGGIVTVNAVGGTRVFFQKIAEAGEAFVTVPGHGEFFTIPMLLTFTLVAPIGTMLSPGQWLRYNAARSTADLKRAAIIFAVCLTAAYLFGMVLVGLGGKVLLPDLANADEVFIRIVKIYMPLWASTLFMVCIMAAAMSTADSNLHALGAILAKDFYKGLLRTSAGQKEVLAVSHVVIFVTTLIALFIVLFVESLPMLVRLGIVSMAFCLQLLPVAADILWLKRGNAIAAFAGMLGGLAVLIPLAFFSGAVPQNPLDVHYGFWALLANISVYVALSYLLPRKEPKRSTHLAQAKLVVNRIN